LVIFDIIFLDLRAFDFPSAYTTSLTAALGWLLPPVLVPFDVALVPLLALAALLMLLNRDKLTPDSRVAADPLMMEMRRLPLGLPPIRWSGREMELLPAWDPTGPEGAPGGVEGNAASSGLLGRNWDELLGALLEYALRPTFWKSSQLESAGFSAVTGRLSMLSSSSSLLKSIVTVLPPELSLEAVLVFARAISLRKRADTCCLLLLPGVARRRVLGPRELVHFKDPIIDASTKYAAVTAFLGCSQNSGVSHL
jgi:hypothetical protein